MMQRIGILAAEPLCIGKLAAELLCRNAINNKINTGGQTNSAVKQ
jgi:hypothetical protein